MGNIAFVTVQDLADFYKNQHIDVKDNCSCNRGREKGFCPPLDGIAHIGGDVDFEKDIVRGRGHQCRLSGDVVKNVAGELKKQSWPAMSYPTFEEFYLYVRSIVNIDGNYPTMDDFLKEFNRRKAALRGSYKKKSITKYP